MTTIPKIAVVILLSVTTIATAHEKNPTSSPTAATTTIDKATSEAQSAVIAVVEKFQAAIKTASSALAEEALAANVVIFEQGHRESSRDEYLGHHFKEDVAFAKVVPSTNTSQVARVIGDMALVTAESTTEGVYKYKPVKGASVATYILARQDNQWRIVHIHWSSRKRS